MSLRLHATAGVLALACSSLHAQPICDLRAAAPPSPAGRFENNADGTVTDKESKLMWMRCSAGQTGSSTGCAGGANRLNHASATAFAAEVNRRGQYFFNDWRLPQLKEIATISERRCETPRIDLAAFPDTPSGAYWTSTLRPATSDDSFAFAFGFDAEGVSYHAKEDPMFVRLVRNAQ